MLYVHMYMLKFINYIVDDTNTQSSLPWLFGSILCQSLKATK